MKKKHQYADDSNSIIYCQYIKLVNSNVLIVISGNKLCARLTNEFTWAITFTSRALAIIQKCTPIHTRKIINIV